MNRRNVLTAAFFGGTLGGAAGMVAGGWIGLAAMDRALPEPGEGGFIPFLIAGIVGLWLGAILGAALVINLKGSGGIRSALYSFWIVPVTAVVLGVPSLWLLPDTLDSPLTLSVFSHRRRHRMLGGPGPVAMAPRPRDRGGLRQGLRALISAQLI